LQLQLIELRTEKYEVDAQNKKLERGIFVIFFIKTHIIRHKVLNSQNNLDHNPMAYAQIV